jgi:hypothetical protein
VLVQSTSIGDVFIGIGASAKGLLDFAFEGRADGRPFLAACDTLDRALAAGGEKKARQLNLPVELALIEDPPLRRLGIAETIAGKADPNDPVHPGWPAGTPDSIGGQYRPKDSTDEAKKKTEKDIRRLGARDAFRIAAIGALKVAATLPLDAVPGLDGISAFATLHELAQTAIDLGNNQAQVDAAVAFVENGPYTLDELRVSPDDQSFSSFNAFKKTTPGLEILARQFGPAGPGNDYHHIVTQGGDNATDIPAEQLHSTQNIAPVPKLVHEIIHGIYDQPADANPKISLYKWLQTQPYEVQHARGVQILKDLGILK